MSPIHRTIPMFDLTVDADPANARQDRLKLVWGDWFTSGSREQLREYLEGLAQAIVSDGDGVEFTLTGSPTGRRRDQYNIRGGRPGNVTGHDHALFSGHLHAYHLVQATDRQAGRLRIFADLSLNPTRYAAYQDRPSRQRQSPELRLAGRTMRRPSPTRRSGIDHEGAQGERMLVPDHDNAIVSDTFFLRNYDRPVWQRHLRNYLEGVEDLLSQVIEDHHPVSAAREINLQEAETYFEFTHANPVAAVAALQERIIAARAQVGVTVYSEPVAEIGVAGNARSITIRRSSAVTIKIYAKTTRRIRVEVTHDLTEEASPIGGSHTTPNLEAIYTWLDLLGQDAARLVNELFSDLRAGLPPPVAHASTAQLLNAVADACSRATDVPTILELLCVNGRLVTGSHDPLSQVKGRLLHSGVIVARPRTTRDTVYTLSPIYVAAAQALRTALFSRPAQTGA